MAIVDLELLLSPISDEEPAGTDQSATPQYLQIIDAMREDDPTIQRESWEEVRVADWNRVQQLCEEILETKAKDLQVAVWLCQALLRNHGIAGFNEGTMLVTGLCQHYWEWLHPQLEEPSLLYRRTNILTKFFNRLEEQLRHIQVTSPDDPELQPYRWGDYLDATHIDRMEESDKRRALSEGRPTSEMFTASLRATPDTFIEQLASDLDQAIACLAELEQVVQNSCEPLRPALDDPSDADVSFGAGREALGVLQQFVRRICGERGIGLAAPTETESEESSSSSKSDGGAGAVAGALQSREDAYRSIERIADFLARIEPHSPVPYLLRRAVKWGRMSAEEMLQELYQNAPDLEQLYRLLGLEPPQQQESSGW
ncbi:MAG: type VI secretion protein [Candidatus Kapaibacterium sp.]|nr:MAG: type VI secretion protein [Candidatus Kapabacteria bacterium]